MKAIDLTQFTGVILTDSENTLNKQLLRLTGDEYSVYNFERLGQGYIKHIKTGNVYFTSPKKYLLSELNK